MDTLHSTAQAASCEDQPGQVWGMLAGHQRLLSTALASIAGTVEWLSHAAPVCDHVQYCAQRGRLLELACISPVGLICHKSAGKRQPSMWLCWFNKQAPAWTEAGNSNASSR